MQFLKTLYYKLVNRFGAKRTLISGALVIVLTVLVLIHLFGREEVSEITNHAVKTVSIAPVAKITGSTGSIETLGTVQAVREARLTTETGGRVTSVPVKLGDAVAAGTVIATLENSTERAAVLQAQGVYEAARANAATSDVGSASADRAYREALTQAVNAYRGAFATTDDVLRNTVDQVFSQPEARYPGVRIDANGRAVELGEERVALEVILDAWAEKTTGDISGNVGSLLGEAETYTTHLTSFVNTLTSLLAEDDAMSSEQEAELLDLRSDFATARTTVNGVLQSLSSARSALIAARTAQEQAEIAATNGGVSLAEAQVKQALGALRLAQANLEKTIIRSPIQGTVNSLTLKEGTTVTAGVPAAIISSSGGLEIVAYVNESDARLITEGTPVTIEDNGNGIVTQIASAIDPITKKIEVRIGISDASTILTNGESVRISVQTETDPQVDGTEVRLPIVAIKMTPEGAVVFTVENGVLVAHRVTLGAILGDTVVISDGITPDLHIVTDARGLRAGEAVTIE